MGRRASGRYRVEENVMKHVVNGIGSICCLVALLTILPESAVSGQTRPAPASRPAEPTASAVAPGDDVRLLETFSEKTIQSEERSIDTIKTVFEGGVTFVSAVLGIAAFFGYRELKSVAKDARRHAVESVQQELASLRELGLTAKEIASQTLRAIRSITIAERSKPPEAARIRQALESVLEVRRQAERLSKLGFCDRELEVWTVSMEGYCYASLNDFARAVEKQSEALRMAPRPDALGYVNLACYLAQAGKLDEAAGSLRTAIDQGGEVIKKKAATDPDLATLRSDRRFRDLFS